MSFDTQVHGARPSWPSLKELLGRLVERPTRSESLERLQKIKQSPLSQSDMVKYGEYLDEAWEGKTTADLQVVHSNLLGDARRLHQMVQDQLTLAEHSEALEQELNDAWSAARNNAAVAKEIYEKAKTMGAEVELAQLRARVTELESQQSLKDFLASQHKELMDITKGIKTTTDDNKATMDGIKTTMDGIKTTTEEIKATTEDIKATTDDNKTIMDGTKITTDDIKTTTNGIKTTMDGIAQAVEFSSTAQPTAGHSKRRITSERSTSGEREASFAGDQRRASLPSLRGRGGSQPSPTQSQSGTRRTSTRISSAPHAPESFSQSSQSATEAHEPASGSQAPEFTFRSAPELATPSPPPSSSQPLIKVGNHKTVDDVYANVLAWDGSEIFDSAELHVSIVSQLRDLIKDNLCTVDASKFHNYFTAGINKVLSTCIWQRVGINPKDSRTVGYYACEDCIEAKRPCLIRIRAAQRLQYLRPHLAPLPDDVRVQGATRRDMGYWVKP